MVYWLHKNVYPWQYDEFYLQNPEMHGKFFQQDWHFINMIQDYKDAYEQALRQQQGQG